MKIKKQTVVYGLLCILALILPLMGLSNYLVRVMVNCLLYVALALSLNLLSGICGQISLGHIGFYAIGAYTSALLSIRLGLPFLVCFLGAGLVAGLLGLAIALPSLRLSGGYLAIITLSFSEVIRLILLNWIDLTNGPMGLAGISPIIIGGYRFSSNKPYYYLMLTFCVLLILGMRNIISSNYGRKLKAMRDDEIAAEAMGVNNYKQKVVVFAVVALIAGLVGSVYAHCMRYIDPYCFKTDFSMLILSMVVLGGMGSIRGSVIAAIVLTALPETLREFDRYRMLAYGLALVIMMLFKTIQKDEWRRLLSTWKQRLFTRVGRKGAG